MNADERRWFVAEGSVVAMVTVFSFVTDHLRSSAFICGPIGVTK
jgi:hypothetical protein